MPRHSSMTKRIEAVVQDAHPTEVKTPTGKNCEPLSGNLKGIEVHEAISQFVFFVSCVFSATFTVGLQGSQLRPYPSRRIRKEGGAGGEKTYMASTRVFFSCP